MRTIRSRLSGAVLAAMTAAAAMTLAAPSAAAQDGFYSDVLEDSYYHAPVRALAASGVFDGTDCPGGMFCPSGPIDRATAAVWITRALGEAPADDDPLEFRYRGELAETRPGPQTFADVDHGLWTAPYIYKLARLGITAGCHREESRFCPDNTVSRGEMASFLRRAFNLPEADPAGFEDLHEGNVHIESIDRLFAAGITVGCSSERFEFCPHLQVTRSQMAAFLYRGLAWRAANAPEDIPDDTPEEPNNGGGDGNNGGGSGSGGTNSGGGGPATPVRPPIGAPSGVEATHYRFSEAIVWQAPDRGADLVTAYRVQWRLDREDYSTDRQQEVAARGDPADLDTTSDGFMILTDAFDMHAVRVTAVTADGDEQGSEALSPYSPQRLEQIIRNQVAASYRSAHPWLAATWAYMQAQPGFLKTRERELGNTAAVWVRIEDSEPLDTTTVYRMDIRTDLVSDQHLWVYIHEMAHVYTLDAALPSAPEAVAVAHLYFQHMIDNSGTHQPQRCDASEFYADTIATAILGARDNLASLNYWERYSDCVGDVTEPTEEAKQVVLDALRGQTPQWLQDTYGTDGGGLDLESLWATLRNIGIDHDRVAVLYQLKDSFGGYCNPAHAQASAHGSRRVRNPWRAGGCVPQPPESVQATPGDGITTVTWDPPAYDVGAPLPHRPGPSAPPDADHAPRPAHPAA